MEVLYFLAEQAVSLVVGFLGGMAYHRIRLRRIARHAPSARATGFHVSLNQRDYDGLPKKEKDVMYAIIPSRDSPE